MISDDELKRFGLLTRASFDYTKWRATLWPDAEVEELSRQAMSLRRSEEPKS